MTYNHNRWSWQKEALAGLCAAVLLALLPLVVGESYARHILIMIFIYGLVAASWDVTLGYGGIFNFGHLALFGIGLYSYGVLTKQFGVNPWLAFVLGGFASSAAAALVSIPILRLKGIYIVLVTFGFSQLAMQLIVSQSQVTGGTLGMVRIPTLPIAGHNLLRDGKLGYYYMALVLLVLGIVSLRAFVRSRTGLSLVALRDNEEYAISRGISLARQRVVALAFSAFFAGVAGAFYGAYLRTASIEVFSMGFTTLILSMVLLGGVGTIYGALIASFFLTIFSEALADLGAWRPMIVAAMIVLIILIYPGGLIALLKSPFKGLRQGRSAETGQAKAVQTQ